MDMEAAEVFQDPLMVGFHLMEVWRVLFKREGLLNLNNLLVFQELMVGVRTIPSPRSLK